MTGIVICGAGQQGKVVADALIASGKLIEGVVDDNPEVEGVLGLSLLGNTQECLKKYDKHLWHVAVGDNQTRKVLIERIETVLGRPVYNVIHPAASVSRSADLDSGIFVAAQAVVGPDAKLGKGCLINHGATVDHDCELGECVHVAPGVNLCGCVKVSECTLIGVGSSVIPGINIGSNCVVGAGSVVVDDVSDNTKIMGNPAK